MLFDLAALTKQIASEYPEGPGTVTWCAVTGEPYVVIGAQHPDEGSPAIIGTVDEGKCAEWSPDEETACLKAMTCLRAYADGREGVLYWRQPPMLDWNEDHTRCKVYMRLLISDKEMVAA